MKTSLLILTLALAPWTLFAQGPLTPPGAPAPTMKALDQIEPRTLISSAPFTISTSGSYYLAANLNVSSGNAVTITVDNVVLDLNGFTISSTASPASGNAITLSGGRHNVRITNGNISGSVAFNGSSFAGAGFQQGIVGTSADPVATTVSFVNVSGCATTGIYLGLATSSTTVTGCNVWNVGGNGIVAVSISDSTAANCGMAAITGHTVMNCRGDCVAGDVGIDATVATNCYGRSATNIGLVALTATNCYGSDTAGTNSGTAIGISANTATGCYGASNHGPGLSADTVINCEGFGSGTGILANYSVENSFGTSIGAFTTGGTGISSNGNALNCFATSGGGPALSVFACAENCYATAAGGDGLDALMVKNCWGIGKGGGSGIVAGRDVENSYGDGSSGTYGISAQGSVTNSGGIGGSYGIQGGYIFNSSGSGPMYGIYGTIVGNSSGFGNTAGGAGIRANIINTSIGDGTNGYGIRAAYIAIGSYGTSGNPAVSAGNKYNMPQ